MWLNFVTGFLLAKERGREYAKGAENVLKFPLFYKLPFENLEILAYNRQKGNIGKDPFFQLLRRVFYGRSIRQASRR